jgi:signal transduction histidine kinase
VSLERVKALEPRLHEALAQRCADLGLGETSTPALMMESISAANARLHGLTQSLARRAAGSRRHADALTAVRAFLDDSSRQGSVEDVLRAIAGSFVRWAQGAGTPTGAGALGPQTRAKPTGGAAVVFQPRPGEPWLLGSLSTDATERGQPFQLATAPAPAGPEGQALDLGELARDTSMGAASDLLAWLSRVAPAAAGGLDLRRLRRLPIAVTGGAAALLLHDREAAGPGEQAALDTLCAAWSAALAGASKQLGARRLSEALADANRRLVEAQSKLTESESLARLGELAAGAAHEMNNPLTVISGRGQLLASRLRDARDRADAEEIARAAGRLTDLITSLHALASPPTLAIEASNLPDLLERATRRAKDRVAGEIGDATGSSLPPIRLLVGSALGLAAVDPGLFGRAIEELVVNALQSGGKRVEMHLVHDHQQGALVLRIKDDGRGLSEHALAHAFDPFFSEKPAGRRPGMGLAMARRYVGLHGGSIDLRSGGENQGTIATITLPSWKWEPRVREAA